MYRRIIQKRVKQKFGTQKAIILVGPRQSGKTTFCKNILKDHDYLHLDADDPLTRQQLNKPTLQQLKSIIGNHNYVFLDEAQRINDIGISLKMIIDHLKDVQLLVTGSSSFDLTGALNEPLTGRKWEMTMLPISWPEFEEKHGYLESLQKLEDRILYGFYPEVLNNQGNEKEILSNLTNSYLFKDIFTFSDLRKPKVLEQLTEALALQISSEVSTFELAQLLGVDKNTIDKYINILEQAYVIFTLRSFSRNQRNEIKKTRKVYFWDTGIRNTIINNFSALNIRQDKGALWENFIMAERYKYNLNMQTFNKMYFWRTFQQQEIDLVETKDNDINAFEIKFSPKKKLKISKTFTNNYNAHTFLINTDNFRDFIMDKSF